MNWADIYGIATLAACAAAWVGKDAARQKIALALLASWAITQFLHHSASPPRLLAYNAGLDLCGLAITVYTRWSKRSQSYSIMAIYMAMIVAHLATLIAHPGSYNGYYILLNLLFCAQLLIVFSGGVYDLGARLVHRYRHHSADHSDLIGAKVRTK